MPYKNYSFSFEDFKLLEVSFKVNRKFDPEKQIELNSNLTIRHEWADKDNILKVFIRIEFSGEECPLLLSIEGGGLFKFNSKPDSDRLEEIAAVNCAALLFPYVRETVSDFIRRAGFPPLHLPPFNFVEAYKKKKQHDDSLKQQNLEKS